MVDAYSFYVKENAIFNKEINTLIDTKKLSTVVKKIIRRFKIKYNISVTFGYTGKDFAWSFINRNEIIFNKNRKLDLLTFIHEIAHFKHEEIRVCKCHTKKLITIIKRMMNYCYRNKSICKLLRISE
jgi:hypothetical protein